MTSNYYLPGLNGDVNRGDPTRVLSVTLNEIIAPKSYLFYSDANAFYRVYCDNFDIFKIREKRFLDFETPNRALITHEYEIQLPGNFDYNKSYFLFNPIKRLSWLKISQEDKRLSIVEERRVKEIVKDILTVELSKMGNSDEVFDELWAKKEGIPCFIKLKDTQNKDFLVTASYYDSIKKDEKDTTFLIKIFRFLISFFSPFVERRIKYEYYPLQKKSSWLYIKSPNNFNVRYNLTESSWETAINQVDYANSDEKEADPDKLSLTIINREGINTEKDTVAIIFYIVIPKSLKIWFISIYYLSIGALLTTGFNVFNSIYLNFFEPIFYSNPIGDLFLTQDIGRLILAIIAAIITTRGWLISEETVFRKYSIRLTFIMVSIIFLYIADVIL